MNKKQRRKKREKEIALNSWYSCMIAMGGIPISEDLYFEARERFLTKHRIKDTSKVKTTCGLVDVNCVGLNSIQIYKSL